MMFSGFWFQFPEVEGSRVKDLIGVFGLKECQCPGLRDLQCLKDNWLGIRAFSFEFVWVICVKGGKGGRVRGS